MKNSLKHEAVAFSSVSELLQKSPAEAKEYEVRCELLTALRTHIANLPFNQTQIAEILGVDQPRVSDIVRGKISKFSLGTLLEFLWKMNFDTTIKVVPPKIHSLDKPVRKPRTKKPVQELEYA